MPRGFSSSVDHTIDILRQINAPHETFLMQVMLTEVVSMYAKYFWQSFVVSSWPSG